MTIATAKLRNAFISYRTKTRSSRYDWRATDEDGYTFPHRFRTKRHAEMFLLEARRASLFAKRPEMSAEFVELFERAEAGMRAIPNELYADAVRQVIAIAKVAKGGS